MFPRINRLPYTVLLELRKSRRFNHGKYISALVTENGEEYFRAAVIIPRKVSKSAYLRNRIKRRIRHFMKDSLYNELKGYDILIYVKPEADEVADKEMEKIEQDVKEVLTKPNKIMVIIYE